MAENQEDRSREDLTEEASQYRIEEYRRRGIVSQSRELTGLAALLAAAVMTYVMAPKMGGQLAEFMREVFRTDLSSRLDLSSTKILGQTLIKALHTVVSVALPVCIAGFLIGVV